MGVGGVGGAQIENLLSVLMVRGTRAKVSHSTGAARAKRNEEREKKGRATSSVNLPSAEG